MSTANTATPSDPCASADSSRHAHFAPVRRRAPAPLPHSLQLARLLDTQFTVPGTDIQFGWDAILGLVPVVGDTISTGLGSLIIADAVRMKARKRVIARMVGNLAVDWLIGLIPVVDVVSDVLFKANSRNAALLRGEWERQQIASRSVDTAVNARPQPPAS